MLPTGSIRGGSPHLGSKFSKVGRALTFSSVKLILAVRNWKESETYLLVAMLHLQSSESAKLFSYEGIRKYKR